MKQACNAVQRRNGNALSPSVNWFFGGLLFCLLFASLIFASCKKEDMAAPEPEQEVNAATPNETDVDGMNCSGLSWQTTWQLQQARSATAKYKNIKKAIKDGYVDISVVVPNMGHHYMKNSLVDGIFDPKKPEILVYHKDDQGKFTLVAVEYAVPLSEPMPQGFAGTADVWDGNEGFQLWLLHAWVWKHNPDGIFNPTNPLVHQH